MATREGSRGDGFWCWLGRPLKRVGVGFPECEIAAPAKGADTAGDAVRAQRVSLGARTLHGMESEMWVRSPGLGRGQIGPFLQARIRGGAPLSI